MFNWFTHTAREIAPHAFPQHVNNTTAYKLGLFATFAAPPLHDPHAAYNAPRVYFSGL
jgi:hypothetical protein